MTDPLEKCMSEYPNSKVTYKTNIDIRNFCKIFSESDDEKDVKKNRVLFINFPKVVQCMFLKYSLEILRHQEKYSNDSYNKAYKIFELFQNDKKDGIYREYNNVTVDKLYKQAKSWKSENKKATVSQKKPSLKKSKTVKAKVKSPTPKKKEESLPSVKKSPPKKKVTSPEKEEETEEETEEEKVESEKPKAKPVSPKKTPKKTKVISPKEETEEEVKPEKTKSPSPKKVPKKVTEKKSPKTKRATKAKIKYEKEYQKHEEPEEGTSVYIYYTTLYEQKPKSVLAITWLTEHGVFEGKERKKLIEKYKKLDEKKKMNDRKPENNKRKESKERIEHSEHEEHDESDKEDKTEDILFEYKKGKPYNVFSNFYGKKDMASFKLVLDGQEWTSTEHYFQAQKFLPEDATQAQKDYAEVIRNAKTPSMTRILGKQKRVGGYKWKTDLNPFIEEANKAGVTMRPDWDQVKESVMRKAVTAKFTQNPSLRKVLLSTKDAILIEDSPWDSEWGNGKNGNGKNKLGKILMKVREKLKE